MIWTAALIILGACLLGALIVAIVCVWVLGEIDRLLSKWTYSMDRWDQQLTRDLNKEREQK
jgi:hypothetical protein